MKVATPLLKPIRVRRLATAFVLLGVVAFALFISQKVSAVNRTWDGGGADNNWSTSANWSGDTVPVGGDIAIFDGTSTKACTIDAGGPQGANVNLSSIQISTGYTGTITQAAGVTLTLGSYVQAGGTFTGGSGDIDVNGGYVLSGGTFTSTTGTLYVAAGFNVGAGGSFEPNNGRVEFDGTGVAIAIVGSETFQDVSFNAGNNFNTTIAVNSTLIVEGTLTLSDGFVSNLGGVGTPGMIEARAGVIHSTNFDGGSSNVRITQAVVRTITLQAPGKVPTLTLATSDVTIQTAGAGTITGNGFNLEAGVVQQGSVPLSFTGAYNQSGGTYTGGSGNLTTGPFTISAGSFSKTSGVLTTGSFSQSGGTFAGGSGNIDVNGFSLSGGIFTSTTGTLFVADGFAVGPAGSFEPNNGKVEFDGTGVAIAIAGSETFQDVSFNAGNNFNTTIAVNSTLIVEGTLTLSDGFVSNLGGVGTPGMIEARAGVIHSANFDGGSSNVRITQPVVRTITLQAPGKVPTLTLATGDVTIDTAGAGIITGNAFNLEAGVVQQGSVPLSFTGAYNQSGGTYTAGSGNLSTGAFTVSNGSFSKTTGMLTMGLFTQSGGTFVGGSGNIHISGFTLSGGTFTSTTGTMFVQTGFTHTAGGTFDPTANGTVEVVGFGAAFDVNSSETFKNLTFNPGGAFGSSIAASDTLIVTGTLNLSDGSVSSLSTGSPGTVSTQGNVVVASSFDGGTAALTFSGSANQTFTNTGGVNPTGVWTVAKTSGTLTAVSSILLGTSQALTITSGTLYLNNSSNLTSGALTIEANGRLVNDSTTTITLGSNLVNSGRVDLQGGGAACPEVDTVLIRSSVAGTRRNWSGAGFFRLVDVDVKDMGGTASLTVFSGTGETGANNGANWTFNAACPTALSISPTVVNRFVNQTQSFTAGGGFAPRTFSIFVDNSGATINSSTGFYTAGTTFNVADTVRVTDAFGSTADATVNVTAPPTRVGFVVQPSNATAALSIAPPIQVAVQDQFGNTVTSATNAITIAIQDNAGGGTLSGTVGPQDAVNGIATFSNLSINRSGIGYTLQAASTGLTSVESNAFNINPGAPAELVFVTQPSNTTARETITPHVQVAVRDAHGNNVSGTVSVHIDFGNNPGGGTFGGSTTTVNTVNGIATFLTLGITSPGNGYTLVASTSGLSTTSNPFNITGLFEVTNTNNSGSGSLHHAILNVNNLPGSETRTITFSISVAPFTIAPAVQLPTITHPVIIDGTTQPDFNGTPIIELSGANINQGVGLRISGGSSTVKGLVINRWNTAIQLENGDGNTIQGNYIGTSVTGSAALGNQTGILISATSNLIGGTTSGLGNLISGNGWGIKSSGSNSTTTILGNRIGTDASGLSAIPNTIGIELLSANAVVGGTTSGEANVIAFNTNRSVSAKIAGVVSIRGNSIYSNGQLGIEVAPDGVNPNDPGDADSGPNKLQNYPVLTTATSANGNTGIQGTLNSTPSSTFVIDFYANPTCDSSGYGEGQTYLGSTSPPISTDASGIASFNVNLPIATTNGHFITATATDPQGNTSEFSQCRVVAPRVSISGRAIDNNGVSLFSTTFNLSGGQTASSSNVLSSSYSFSDLPSGLNYTVRPLRTNYDFAPASRTYSNISADQSNQDFVGTKTRYTISGLLTASNNGVSLPLAGVTMTLSGAAARTKTVNSSYNFSDLNPGSYTLTPSKDGYVFTPDSVDVTITNSDQQRNFTATTFSPLEGRIIFNSGGWVGSINADGSAYNQFITTRGVSQHQAISRDGKKLVYVRGSGVGPAADGTYTSNADGSNETLISGNFFSSPEWSPAGTKIAFSGVRVANADGSAQMAVPIGSLTQTDSPTWLSNTRLAFSGFDGNDYEIYAVNTDGTNLTQLTNNSFWDGGPSASPDGTKIAFVSGATISTFPKNLQVMNSVNGSGQTQIRNDADSNGIAWSPDGTRIAFIRRISANSRDTVAVNSALGTGLRLIYGFSLSNLSWGPAYEFATTTGSNVIVNAGGAGVIFGGVSSGGTTTFTPIRPADAGRAPNGFVVGGLAYEISTTAAYTAPVTVCFNVPTTTASTQLAFNALSLMHNEGGVLVDRTTSRNFSARSICGTVTTLSPFVLAEQFDNANPSIGGLVQDDNGNPLDGVFVQLTGTETRNSETDAFGIFSFVNLTAGGNYNVQPKLPGYLFTEYSHDFVNVNGDNSAVFIGTSATFSISGKAVDENGNGVSGVEISLEGATTSFATTDVNGDYSFTDLPADGAFFVRAFKDGFGFTPFEQIIDSLTSDQAEINFIIGPPSCALGTSSSSQFFLMNGGAGSVNIETGSSCGWIASASETWITIVSADNGTGNGVVDFEVRENFTGSARQATINISGQLLTIVQDGGLGEDCNYSINPGFQSYSGAGGDGVITVISEERCAWQAVSSAPWVTITSSSVGIGNGSVSYTVDANPGPGGRSATITIGGKVFAVKQKAP